MLEISDQVQWLDIIIYYMIYIIYYYILHTDSMNLQNSGYYKYFCCFGMRPPPNANGIKNKNNFKNQNRST